MKKTYKCIHHGIHAQFVAALWKGIRPKIFLVDSTSFFVDLGAVVVLDGATVDIPEDIGCDGRAPISVPDDTMIDDHWH